MAAPKGNQYGCNDGGRPKRFETVEEMQVAIDKYFKDCDEKTKQVIVKNSADVITVNHPEPYTIEGLALSLGFTSREALLNYEKAKGYEDFFSTIKNAKLKTQQNKVVNGLNGNYNPAVAIFDLKNNHGYKDKTETDITSGGEKIAPLIYIPSNGRD